MSIRSVSLLGRALRARLPVGDRSTCEARPARRQPARASGALLEWTPCRRRSTAAGGSAPRTGRTPRPSSSSTGGSAGSATSRAPTGTPTSSTRVVDLDGALVLPAFVDAHAHLSHTGMGLRGVDLARHHLHRRGAARDRGCRAPPRRAPAVRPELAGARLGRGPADDGGRARPGRVRRGRLRLADRRPLGGRLQRPGHDLGRRPARRLDRRRARHPRRQERRSSRLRRRPQRRPAARRHRGRPPGRGRPGDRHASTSAVARCSPPPATSPTCSSSAGAPTSRAPSATGPRRSPTPSRRAPWSPCTAPPASGATSTSTARSGRTPPTCASAYADDPGCRGTAYRSSRRRARPRRGLRRGRHPERVPRHRRRRDGHRARGLRGGRRPRRASTSCAPPGRGSSTPRWSTPTASRGWRAWAWSRACSRPSTPSGVAPPGMYEARLGRDRVPGTNPFAAMAAAGVRPGVRLGLPGDRLRPVAARAGRRRAPRGGPAPRRRRPPSPRTPPGATRRPARTGEGCSGSAGRRPSPSGTRRTLTDDGLPDVRTGAPCRPAGSPCATASCSPRAEPVMTRLRPSRSTDPVACTPCRRKYCRRSW